MATASLQRAAPVAGPANDHSFDRIDLLPVTVAHIGDAAVPAVDARSLHAFLGVARDFNQWMREQVERARLVRDRDYVSYEDVGNPSGGRPRKEASITVDAAKHIAMLSGSDRGFEVRDYFIECEKRLRGEAAPQVPRTLAQALRLAADQAEQIEAQAAALALAAPKVEFHDRYSASTGNKGVREVAKLLGANEREFVAWLTREDGPMYRLAGSLTPKAPHFDAGRFAVKAGTADHGDSSHAFNQAKFTPKGVTWIAGEWGKRNVALASATR